MRQEQAWTLVGGVFTVTLSAPQAQAAVLG